MINKSRLRRADVWFNLNYFQESFSSLNRSFLESSEEDYNISSFTMFQQIIGIGISAVGNSSFAVLPLFVVLNFYQEENKDFTEPLLLNGWRMQCVSIAFTLLALFRKIVYLDVYFRKDRVFRLLKHSLFGGISITIWTTGVIYSSQMDSLFTSYLFGYSFSVIVSIVAIILGTTALKKPSIEQESDHIIDNEKKEKEHKQK